MEHLALILTAISCTAAATWLIRSAISDVAKSLAVHVAEDEAVHAKVQKHEAQIIDLAKKRRR